MKTLQVLVVVLAVSVIPVAYAQQTAPPGSMPMGPGMMMGMHQQMQGMMQQMGGMMQQFGEMMSSGQMSAEQTKRMGEMLKEMGGMMGGMATMGRGQMGPMNMPEMSQMMQHMAEILDRERENCGTILRRYLEVQGPAMKAWARILS